MYKYILTMTERKEILKLRVWFYVSVVQASLIAIPQSRLQTCTSGVFLIQMASNILLLTYCGSTSNISAAFQSGLCPTHAQIRLGGSRDIGGRTIVCEKKGIRSHLDKKHQTSVTWTVVWLLALKAWTMLT